MPGDLIFKGLERPSDITIFDCYEYAKLTGREDDDKGYSSIFVHSEKGKKVMEGIASKVECFSIDAEELVQYLIQLHPVIRVLKTSL